MDMYIWREYKDTTNMDMYRDGGNTRILQIWICTDGGNTRILQILICTEMVGISLILDQLLKHPFEYGNC